MAQLVKHPTSAQVMISQFVGSSPTLGSVLTARSLEAASDSVSLSLCPSPITPCLCLSKINKCKKKKNRGSWVAQSVKRPTSVRVTISRSVSSSPARGSGLMAQSLEPASDSVSLSLCPSPIHALPLSVSKIKKR